MPDACVRASRSNVAAIGRQDGPQACDHFRVIRTEATKPIVRHHAESPKPQPIRSQWGQQAIFENASGLDCIRLRRASHETHYAAIEVDTASVERARHRDGPLGNAAGQRNPTEHRRIGTIVQHANTGRVRLAGCERQIRYFLRDRARRAGECFSDVLRDDALWHRLRHVLTPTLLSSRKGRGGDDACNESNGEDSMRKARISDGVKRC